MAPEPVPASTMMNGRGGQPPRLAQRNLDHLFGLRSGDEHTTVHQEIQRPEGPVAEDVLQRLAAQPECRQGTGGVHARSADRLSAEGGRRAQHLLDDEPCLVAGAQRRGELSNQLAPCHGVPSPSPAS